MGLWDLYRALWNSDKKRVNFLTRHEFCWAIKSNGHQLTKTEFDKLFKYFDRDGNDKVCYRGFLKSLTGQLNEKRLAVVKEVYHKLDLIDGLNDNVTIDDMLNACNIE